MSTVTNAGNLRLANIRTHVTIFDVLEKMGHTYEPATQQIRCPFHTDHSPSARVYADQNKIWCFTEQKSWDVLDAVQTWRKLSLEEACAWLEQEFSVPGVLQTLQGAVRARLSARPAPQTQQLAEYTEQRLHARRRELGFTRYTQLLQALDVSVYDATDGKLPAAQFIVRMQRLIAAQ